MKKFLLFFMSLVSFFGYSQLPENFETSFPPTGWNTFTNGVGTAQNWGVTTNGALIYPDGGLQSAFVNRENIGMGNTSEDWLVTPAISITATSQLRFFTRQLFSGDAGTSYQLRVSTTSPTNAASFTTVQTWNEIQLNAIYNQYEEKVVNLSTYNGQQIYIAFVRVFTQPGATLSGDAWLVDNVRLADACLDPSVLTDTNNTATTVSLGWINNGTATQWEVEILLTGGTPTGNGTVVNSNPYTATGLLPNTTYIFYVRAICAGGVTSNWIGPYNFQTLPQGLSCSDPIQITTVPYSTTDNTNVYGNNINGPQGAGCVGGGTNYLASNEVVYEFVPSFTGNVSITSTPVQNNSSIFVYSSCANIGNTCLAGVANNNNSPRQITGFAVTAGQSYFIVISSSSAVASINYTLVIQRESCAAPNNLAINNLSNTSVDLAWGNPGGATSWQVVNQPQGGGIPTGAGTTTNNNTAYTLTGLTPGTNYEYWVRADCNDGTFSLWSGPFIYTTTLCPPTEQCNYVFEVRDTGGNGWQGNTMNVSQNGTVVAVLTGPLPSNGTTPIQVSVALCNNQPFVLYWNQPATGSGISPEQVGVSIIEPTANNVIYTKAPGTGSQNSQLFNGVAQCTPPTCPQPTNIVVTGVNSNSGFVNWSDNAGATQWQIIVQPLGTGYPTGSGIVTSTRPYQMTGLNSVTQYEVYVRAICSPTDSSVWSGPIAFTTTPNYCAGDQFYDTGGPSGNYSNNESGIPITICPDNIGDVVTVSFNSFNTQAGNDTLEIFNGNSVSATLLGTFSGINLPPNFTSSDASGCLTFRFTSNGATTASGWDATITCGPPPSCPAPISLSLISINGDEFTIGWNETGTATQWEVIYLPTGSTPPTAASSGTIVNSNPVTIVGAAAGFYDVYVRAICGPSNVSQWSSVPIQFYVVAGLQACAGVNIGTSNNGVIDVCSTDNCVDLSASYFETGNTSTYKVDPIAFAPPFPFTGGIPLNISTDDIWSGNIPLPFEFCFFGNNYTQCSVGSNGVVTFNPTTANQFCPWSFTQTIPNTAFPIKNAIYGVYQDINPAITTPPAMPDINYQVLGSAPCRVFVFNISNVAQFQCGVNVPLQTSQIVMYETSNVIEVYVLNRVPCTTWNPSTGNGGNGVIGIQNNAGTQAHVPPGRNTGAWSAANEGWRFTPDGAPNVSFSWLKDGQFYSNDLNINVCINTTTNMTAQAIYTACDGDQTITTQNVLLNYKQQFEPTFTAIAPICNGETFTLGNTSLEGVTGTWSPAVDNTQTTEYTFTPDVNQCALPTRMEVIVRDQVVPSFVSPAPICAGETAPVLPTTSNNGITGVWSPSTIDNMTSGQYIFTPDSGQCGVQFVLDYTVLPSCDLNVIATAVFLDNCETASNGEFFNVTGSGTDLIGASVNVFPNSNLGTYVQNSGNLVFKGAQLRTFKGVSSNVCGVDLKYRVYESSATPGAFTTLTLPFLDDCVAGSFPTGGTCDPGDQQWQDVSSALDLTSLAPGNYKMEVYYEVSGDLDSPTDCDDTILVDNNGSYYLATFSIQSNPTFTYVNPTYCNATNGSITISGFNPSDQYSVTYTDDGNVVGPTNYYANLSGQIVLSGLNAGAYANFNFSINGCNVSTTNTITLVNPVITPTFNQIGPFCAGTTFSLPIASNEGISGSWTPAINNAQTTVYTFVPNANQCAVNSSPYTVTINPLPFITQVTPVDFCPGADATFTIEGSANAIVSYQINSGITQTLPLNSNGLATITVTAPTANVILTLSLINDSVCTGALNITSTANLLPLPNVSSLVAVNPIVCIGSDASFTIIGTPNAIVTYNINGGINQTLLLNATGSYTLVVPSPSANVDVVLVDITNPTTTCSRILTGINASVAIVTVPVPTVTITLPTCTVPTATIEVTSPLINQLNYPSNLFISEVTDSQPGDLSYIEIYNGTGTDVDMSNYKLRLYNGGPVNPNCEYVLSGILANDDVIVIKIGTSANLGGVIPDLSFNGCFNINNNDNIRLTNLSNVEIDIWGYTNGAILPYGVGYNYRRITTGTVLPTINWNPADWIATDWNTTTLPPDYSNVGIYTLFVASYEYVLSNGTTSQTQSTSTYSGVVPGSYTLVAHDMVNNCYSQPLNITINPPVYTNPVTNFTYTTPVCADSANLLPDTSAAGFTSGGQFTSTTGLVINTTTGEIDVVNSTAGNYTVTYSVLADLANCVNASSSTFDIVIQSSTQATFNPIADVCVGSNNTELPSTSLEGYTGTWSSASINTTTAGDFTYTFTPDPQFCAPPVSMTIKIENCLIQKGISPNGDQYNQFFDLSNFSVSKLEIFNRYGKKVYTRVNYKKEWEGQTNSGDELPDGTYYYVIEFSDRDSKTGWIYINRQQ